MILSAYHVPSTVWKHFMCLILIATQWGRHHDQHLLKECGLQTNAWLHIHWQHVLISYLLFGVHGQNPLSGLLASPPFLPVSVGTLLLLQWLHYSCGCVGNASLLQEAHTSACTPFLLWSYPHVSEYPHFGGHPGIAGSAYPRGLLWPKRLGILRGAHVCPVKSPAGLMSIQWQTCPAPSLLGPCSGFPPFPTISAGHLQMGSWFCYFDFIAIEVVGHLSLHPSFSVPTEKDTISFMTPVAEATIHQRKATKCVQHQINARSLWPRGQAAHAHHDPPGPWQQHALNWRHWVCTWVIVPYFSLCLPNRPST